MEKYSVPPIGTPFIRLMKEHWLRLIDGEKPYFVIPNRGYWKYADYCYAGKIKLGINDYKSGKLWSFNPSRIDMSMEEFMFFWQKHYKDWNNNPDIWIVETEIIGVRPS